MSKQTLKQRKALGTGSAKKAASRRTAAKPAAALLAARAGGFSAGVDVTHRFHTAVEAARRGREMTTHDIGCWGGRFLVDGVLATFHHDWEAAGQAEALPEAKPRRKPIVTIRDFFVKWCRP